MQFDSLSSFLVGLVGLDAFPTWPPNPVGGSPLETTPGSLAAPDCAAFCSGNVALAGGASISALLLAVLIHQCAQPVGDTARFSSSLLLNVPVEVRIDIHVPLDHLRRGDWPSWACCHVLLSNKHN
jgi:hypothetical protein